MVSLIVILIAGFVSWYFMRIGSGEFLTGFLCPAVYLGSIAAFAHWASNRVDPGDGQENGNGGTGTANGAGWYCDDSGEFDDGSSIGNGDSMGDGGSIGSGGSTSDAGWFGGGGFGDGGGFGGGGGGG